MAIFSDVSQRATIDIFNQIKSSDRYLHDVAPVKGPDLKTNKFTGIVQRLLGATAESGVVGLGVDALSFLAVKAQDFGLIQNFEGNQFVNSQQALKEYGITIPEGETATRFNLEMQKNQKMIAKNLNTSAAENLGGEGVLYNLAGLARYPLSLVGGGLAFRAAQGLKVAKPALGLAGVEFGLAFTESQINQGVDVAWRRKTDISNSEAIAEGLLGGAAVFGLTKLLTRNIKKSKIQKILPPVPQVKTLLKKSPFNINYKGEGFSMSKEIAQKALNKTDKKGFRMDKAFNNVFSQDSKVFTQKVSKPEIRQFIIDKEKHLQAMKDVNMDGLLSSLKGNANKALSGLSKLEIDAFVSSDRLKGLLKTLSEKEQTLFFKDFKSKLQNFYTQTQKTFTNLNGRVSSVALDHSDPKVFRDVFLKGFDQAKLKAQSWNTFLTDKIGINQKNIAGISKKLNNIVKSFSKLDDAGRPFSSFVDDTSVGDTKDYTKIFKNYLDKKPLDARGKELVDNIKDLADTYGEDADEIFKSVVDLETGADKFDFGLNVLDKTLPKKSQNILNKALDKLDDTVFSSHPSKNKRIRNVVSDLPEKEKEILRKKWDKLGKGKGKKVEIEDISPQELEKELASLKLDSKQFKQYQAEVRFTDEAAKLRDALKVKEGKLSFRQAFKLNRELDKIKAKIEKDLGLEKGSFKPDVKFQSDLRSFLKQIKREFEQEADRVIRPPLTRDVPSTIQGITRALHLQLTEGVLTNMGLLPEITKHIDTEKEKQKNPILKTLLTAVSLMSLFGQYKGSKNILKGRIPAMGLIWALSGMAFTGKKENEKEVINMMNDLVSQYISQDENEIDEISEYIESLTGGTDITVES